MASKARFPLRPTGHGEGGRGRTLVQVDEAALRGVRDIILGADPSMRERIQYGITFSSTKSGDFAALVRSSEPGVNLRLMRGRRLRGHYPHLEGTAVRRMRIADRTAANARAAELRSMVKEWCALGDTAK